MHRAGLALEGAAMGGAVDQAAIYETVPCGVVVGAADGRFSYANRVMAAMLDVSPDQGAAAFEAVTARGLVDECGRVLPCSELPCSRALVEGHTIRGAIVGIPRDDGTVARWLRIDATPVRVDGVLSHTVSMVIDITESRQAEARLKESEERFRSIFEESSIGMGLADPVGNWLVVNDALCQLLGYEREELLRTPIRQLNHPEDRDAETQHMRALVREPAFRAETREKRFVRKDGRIVQAQINLVVIRDEHGMPAAYTAQIQDLTARHEAETALRESEAQLRLAMEAARLGTYERNLKDNQTVRSQGMADLLGIPIRRFEASFLAHVHPDDRERLKVAMIHAVRNHEDYEVEFRVFRGDGEVRWLASRARVIYDDKGRADRVLGVSMDITERKQAEERLAYLALHDGLTGLPNRVLLNDRLEQAIEHARRDRQQFALLVLDIDGFKDVNDSAGHHVGDNVLREIAGRLRDAVRANDTVARMGGDEFAVILPRTAADGALDTAAKLRRGVDGPFAFEGRSFSIGASVGIALYPDHGASVAELMQHADRAMYHAKRARLGFALADA